MKSILLALLATVPCSTLGFVTPLAPRLVENHGISKLPATNRISRAAWSRLMAMKEIGVGVIGAGRIGVVHLEALAGW